MNLRASRPVPDKEAYQFIVDNINGNSLYEKDLPEKFCQEYLEWIQSSKLNNLINLNGFNRYNLYMVHHNRLIFFI